MKTRTLVATFAIAALAAPAARAQESRGTEHPAAAGLEASMAAASMKANLAWVLELSQSAQQSAAEQQARSREIQERAAEQQERAKALQERVLALYNEGKLALDNSQWDRARELFARVLAEKGERADAAQYWIAYAQYKMGLATAALDSLRNLETVFPDSRYLKDAKALELQLQGASPATVEATSDEELKLLALNSLISTNSDQALEILQKILSGNQSPQVKKRALFILSQSRSPKAREILAATAKGASNPDLQMEALEYLGVFGGAENFKLLDEVYAAASDRDIKRKILEAYMIGNRKDSLLKAAKGEPDAELRKRAVTMLGAAHATAELWDLYQREQEVDVRRATLEGLFIAGDVDRLIEVARTEKDSALRKKAIQFMGMRRDAKANALLTEIYWQQGQTSDVKKSVIDGLFIQNNAKALIDIAKKETDASLKREAVSRLSLMKSKEATDFLLELINK